MGVRDVIQYPDPRLKATCRAVEPGEDVSGLVADLVDTMRAHPGCVGVAAPQLGELLRVVVVDVAGHRKADTDHGLLVLCNPRIAAGDGSVVTREGCLSIPDFTGNVQRVEQVTVEATAPDGTPTSVTSNAYEARVILHELDHLDGILFLDRVASARDVFPRRRYR